MVIHTSNIWSSEYSQEEKRRQNSSIHKKYGTIGPKLHEGSCKDRARHFLFGNCDGYLLVVHLDFMPFCFGFLMISVQLDSLGSN